MAILAAALWPPPAAATVLLSQEEALALAFPDAAVERRTAYLNEDQLQEARLRCGPEVEIRSGVVPHYVALQDGALAGVAYFDTHRVRTLAETVMVVVSPSGRLTRIEVISFKEPMEYLPRPAWIRQFDGRGLDEDLALKRGIRPLTGATLTARSITDAARRILALHGVIAPAGPEKAAPRGDGGTRP